MEPSTFSPRLCLPPPATAPKSLFGMLAGREEQTRIVLASGGTLVGVAKKNDDGSLTVARPGASPATIAEDRIAELTSAPFPPAFVDQFTGVPVQDARFGGGIDALTGATVTSQAVVAGIDEAARHLKSVVSGD